VSENQLLPGDAVLSGRVVEFVRLARSQRFRVGIRESADALEVAACVNLAHPEALRAGLRSLLCSNPQDWKRFDALFDSYWRLPSAGAIAIQASGFVAGDFGGAGQDAMERAPREGPEGQQLRDAPQRVGASRQHTSSDFRLFALNQDTRALEQWIESMARRMRKRLLRRHHAQSRGRHLHLRRTLRHSLRYGGVPLDLVYRERRRELPRLVLITDVSRSMSSYSYFFLRFARGILDAFRRADAFVFHTRLVAATDTLRERDSRRLKEKIAWIAAGWGGGTRIGECLQEFHREHARRLAGSRSIVFIVSDGYDTGEPELLGEQVRRLRQRASRVVWLNPLLGREDYTPSAGGMQAALAHLDAFAPAHDLASLMKLEKLLVRL
jgi:uncharacterized protein